MAVSFQATKPFSTGEGGAVIWKDADGLMAVARAINFGFLGTRESKSPSFNGKMSEFHAAVGNASLDAWDETLVAQQTTCAAYSGWAETAGLTDRLILHPVISSCYALFRASSEAEADAVTSPSPKETSSIATGMVTAYTRISISPRRRAIPCPGPRRLRTVLSACRRRSICRARP